MSAAPIPFRGKRTQNFVLPRNLCCDEELAAKIRARADANVRTIQLEILWLIERGIEAEERREERG